MEPKIRLKGFSGDLVETTIKDLCEINPKSFLPDTFEYVDLESVVGTEMISHRTENKVGAPSRAQRLAKRVDIFYGKPIKNSELGFKKGGSDEYKAATDMIFARLLDLGGYSYTPDTKEQDLEG